ncbi:MAG: hypothetical protein KAJ10_05255 [Thermodesulfovibrionia bacterium]|nr:hypothetical protein [Thermodesulfovibrionia bacterium]
MTHTLPDYTSEYKMDTISGVVDNGELAARLGSVNTFDRRGNVIFMDDFEASLFKWRLATVGAGAAGVLASEYARNGSQAARLTAGSGLNSYAVIYRYWATPTSTKVGFEASFTTHADVDRIVLDISIYDGTTYNHATAAVSISSDLVYISIGPAGTQTLFSSLNLYNFNYSFHTLKVVFDYATGKYVRVIFDDQEADASAYSIETAASAVAHSMFFGVWSVNSKAGNPDIYVDDVIITQNEP